MEMFNIQFRVFLLVMLFSPVFLLAQEPSFTASVSKNRVAVGETFQLSFALNTSGANFKPPSLNEFDVYSGPNQSTSVQFYNGNMSQSITYSFVIAAKREGKHTIGSAAIVANGKRIESKPIAIEVVKGSPQQGSAHGQHRVQPSQPRSSGSAETGDLGDNLFIKCLVDKKKAYQGEEIIVTYKLYTRVSIVDNALSKNPSFNGFWTEEIPSKKQAELYTENYEGITYQVAELKKMVLFPQRAGTLELDPLEMECIVRQRSRSNNIFDQFFGGAYQDFKAVIKSKPVRIEVLKLPEQGRPENFNGAVGQYSIEATIDREKVKTNEPVNLKYTINGKGNIRLVDIDKPELPADLESYDPKSSEKVIATADGVHGSKSFNFLVIPRYAGSFDVPAVGFSYFDPEKAQYVKLQTAPFNIDVEQGEAGSSPIVSGSNKQDITVVGNDIRFIKTDIGEVIKPEQTFFNSTVYYTLLGSPVLALLLITGYRRRQIRERSDVVSYKSKNASKVAHKRLELSHSLLNQKNYNKFYEEIYKGLNYYLVDKFKVPLSELDRTKVISLLSSAHVKDETTSKYIQVIETCEMARFAPVNNDQDAQRVYDMSVNFIKETEEAVK